MAISPQDIKKVKAQGFLLNRGTNHFSGRVITKNGVLTANQLKTLSEASVKFGNGNVTFTSRLTVEVPSIAYDNIESFQKYIAKAGMVTGGTGPKVRPIVSCKGTTCVFGLYDTQALAQEIHTRFYEGYRHVVLPHKFKIGVGGCPNNCVKPDINDLGIVGQRVPKFCAELCKSCKNCNVSLSCPMDAAKMEHGALSIDAEACNNCGRCLSKCTFNAIEKTETLYRVYVGGRWGKLTRMGTPISKLFTHDEILDVVEKALLLFKSKGETGERFGETIDRLGIEEVHNLLISDNLLKYKDKILEEVTICSSAQ